MLKKIDIIRRILKRKNAQIREEREKYIAEKNKNYILATHLTLLTANKGEIRIPAKDIREAMGKYYMKARMDGDYFIIKCVETGNQEKIKEEMRG